MTTTIPTKPTSDDYIALEDQYNAKNYKPLDVVLERGEGIWVWDVDGKRYLDFLSAYSAVNQGHTHPRILQALIDQASTLPLTSRAFRNNQLPAYAQQVCELTGYEKMLPINSGVEAVETSLKIARKWGYEVKGIPAGQAEIITCTNNFHGRTITVVTFSDDPVNDSAFGPYTPGFRTVEFGDADALEAAITPNTVGFLFEPIQGEGGVVLPPDGYLHRVREICSKHNVLMIADEIQTGLGRTGKLLACDWEAIRPDMVLLGKALSGGFYPVSAVVADAPIMDVIQPGDHGSTFGGNPIACVVAKTAIDVLQDENLIENAEEQGAYLLGRLKRLESPYIKEVRGRGLLIGVELHHDAGGARRFCEALQHKGVLCKGTHEHIIRFAPPLVITREDIDWAMEQIESVLC